MSRENFRGINGDGAWVTFAKGHRIPPAEQVAIIVEELGHEGPIAFREFYAELRRLKWCSNHDWPCEFEGDWHKHFLDLKPNEDPNTHWTEIRVIKESAAAS